MRAGQVSRANGPIELVERDVPEPAAGQVRVAVKACGICHSDTLTREGTWPGIQYPRVPGHEIAGLIDAVGPGVKEWKVGQRVGIGWHGGHCGYCRACRRGDFIACLVAPQVPGITYDGGYAEFVVAPASVLARIPDTLTFEEAAPLLCAGVTTFNSLRHSGAGPGDLVAILGLGGLGHLGAQFAVKMGMKTVGIARGKEKEPLARKLGAHVYIDSQAQDPAAELQKLGGAKAIIATVTSGKAMEAVIGGLDLNGRLVLLGLAPDTFPVSAMTLITGRRSIAGWPAGNAADSEDTLAFCALTGVRSMNEIYPLEKVSQAYDRMISGKARFRVVLGVGSPVQKPAPVLAGKAGP
jgi:alcohol dehydrogenase/propanol-preferring alcohol dehydrogenase